MVVHKIVDILEAQGAENSTGCWESTRTLVVVLVGPCRDVVGGLLQGGVRTPPGVLGMLSAPTTCGIPPGNAVGESLPGDSQTFFFLLALVSQLESCS